MNVVLPACLAPMTRTLLHVSTRDCYLRNFTHLYGVGSFLLLTLLGLVIALIVLLA